jgi:hypothetical protein
MGALNIFDIINIKQQHNLNIFVETGTGIGSSLIHVLETTIQSSFEQYYSIEISKNLYERCLFIPEKYNNQSVKILNDTSVSGLETILQEVSSDKNIFFWLDAHFPDADHNFASYTSTQNKSLRIPLEEEIQLIKKYRNNSKDYFIIDDLRIYEDGNYEGGNWADRTLYGGSGIQFIYDAFEDSHNITKLNNGEGYIVLQPK